MFHIFMLYVFQMHRFLNNNIWSKYKKNFIISSQYLITLFLFIYRLIRVVINAADLAQSLKAWDTFLFWYNCTKAWSCFSDFMIAPGRCSYHCLCISWYAPIQCNYIFLVTFSTQINSLLHNVCCKIFKVCLTILRHCEVKG